MLAQNENTLAGVCLCVPTVVADVDIACEWDSRKVISLRSLYFLHCCVLIFKCVCHILLISNWSLHYSAVWIHAIKLPCIARCEYTCPTSCILFDEIQLLLYIILLSSVLLYILCITNIMCHRRLLYLCTSPCNVEVLLFCFSVCVPTFVVVSPSMFMIL